MKNKTVFILAIYIVIQLFTACSSKKETTDVEVIPAETLTKILVDMHFIDGVVNSHNNTHNEDERIYLSTRLYDSLVFQKYGVTDSLFKQTIEYYTLNDKIKEVYTAVLDSLNTRKGILQQEQTKQNKAKQ